MPTQLGSKVHSMVTMKVGDEDTVVVVLEDGNAHYFNFRSMDWISMGMVPDGVAYESYLQPKKEAAKPPRNRPKKKV